MGPRVAVKLPEWKPFASQIGAIFEKCRKFDYGAVATYIPQLARVNPDQWV